MLQIAIDRMDSKLKSLENESLQTQQRKDILKEIQTQVFKANQKIGNIQYEIKIMPKDREEQKVGFQQQLQGMRSQVNDL